MWKQRFKLSSIEKRTPEQEQEKIIARNKKQLMILEENEKQLKNLIIWLRRQEISLEKVTHNETRLQLNELSRAYSEQPIERNAPMVPKRRLTPNEILMRIIKRLEVPVVALRVNQLMRKCTNLPKYKRKEVYMQNLKGTREKNKELEKEEETMNPTTPSSESRDPAVSLPPRDPQPYMVRVPKKTLRVVENAPVASLETASKGPLPPNNPRKRQLRYSSPPQETAKERQQQRVNDELRRKHSEEILVWKERFERSQAERKSLERRMYRQAQEFQERFDETVDNISWKERYAHLENFCRTCKGENINLKVELNGIKKEMDKREKEITELQLDLAYVRSLCPMPIPPRVKKQRKPRKPKLLSPLPPPLSPSAINL
ncbi:hypothetical protein GCK72_023452 [Caenorhabditis remanei]|uniref:Uncharacterized protein n=1 Tax=Caenorhabditis remanei TaxID=31234 RepID=A0A6A5FWY1_CAERE|nr:hypothetical protein GCK72_023452 [Caenorhabditis remanei]KAF1746994.1 hypothetical protein GCK72_023452 [Caenorhabditis remanei]